MEGADRKTLPPFWFALGLFTLAFAIRFAFALQWQSMPYGQTPLLDAQTYDRRAIELGALELGAKDLAQNGGGYGHVFYQSPLYPYLLSFLYRVVGHSYLAVSVLNAVLDSGTVVLVGMIGRSLFGRAAGIVAGLLAAFYAPMIFYTAPPMKEPLALFLLALFLFMALRVLRDNHLRTYAASGLLFGLAVLTRGNLLLLPVLPVFAFLAYRRTAVTGILLFSLAFSAALLPTTIHNYRIANDFVPIASADGFNLYIGHSSYANGINAYPPEISTSPEQERLDTKWVAEQEAGHPLRPSQVSAFWRDKAIDYALHNPMREITLLGRKFFAFWNAADSFDNYDVAFIKQNFPSLLNLPLIGFSVISALAAFAVFSRRADIKQRNVNFIIACLIVYMVSVLIFYVTDRYRLPVVVFLFPLAGAAFSNTTSYKSKNLLAGVVGAAIFLTAGLSPPLEKIDLAAFDWGIVTTIYADQDRDAETLDAFHNAIALSQTGAGAQSYIRAAGVYEKAGQMTQSTALIAEAVRLFPQDGVALYNWGRVQAGQGRLDDALATLQKARQLAPAYGLIPFAQAKIYQKKGDMARAQEILWQGLSINPDDINLLNLAKEWNLKKGD